MLLYKTGECDLYYVRKQAGPASAHGQAGFVPQVMKMVKARTDKSEEHSAEV